MKHKVYSCPTETLTLLIVGTVIVSVLSLCCILGSLFVSWITALVWLVVFSPLWGLIAFLWRRNQYLIEIDETGIRSKWFFLRWEDICEVNVRAMQWFGGAPARPYIESSYVMYIGVFGNVGGVLHNPKKGFSIPLSPETLQAIIQYGKGKSQALDKELRWM